MKTVIFIYNFPHKKTQDFLIRLSLSGIKPDLVIASPPVQLKLPKSILKDKYKHIDLIDPKFLCQLLKIRYIESKHNSTETVQILKDLAPDIGIIAAARILKSEVIDTFKIGIVNFHPGIIPENRGLNAVKWAIFKNIPQGMTIHFIDKRIDAGKILKKLIIPIYRNDTIRDINLRIYETQVVELSPVINSILNNDYNLFEVPFSNEGYHPPTDESIDNAVIQKFNEYKDKWGIGDKGWTCKCGLSFRGFDKSSKLVCNHCGTEYKLRDKGIVALEEIFVI